MHVALSIVVPFYRKLAELRRVLPLNAKFFGREGYEVVVVLDEPTEERAVLDLIGQFPEIKWRVLVNDRDHAWRAPCRPINVGVVHSVGEHVLVVSPESALATDVPAILLDQIATSGRAAAAGWVRFATFDDLAERSNSPKTALDEVPQAHPHRLYYGSICVRRDELLAIGGYDESLEKWGGDDDNVRARLKMAGVDVIRCDGAQVLHLAFEPRAPLNRKIFDANPQTKEELGRVLRPAHAVVNEHGAGREFERIAFDWRSRDE